MENNNIVNDIERIVKENKVQVIESNGRTFATKSLVEIEPRKDIAAEIRFSDLSSIVEIVKREMQRFVLPIYINIESEACVSVITSLDGERYFISDIGMRMLKARELMLAQGFPPDYIIDIESHIGKRYSEAKQIARMGNAVCPPVAEALVRANCAEIASQRVIATMAMLNAVIDESCQRKRQYRRAAQ